MNRRITFVLDPRALTDGFDYVVRQRNAAVELCTSLQLVANAERGFDVTTVGRTQRLFTLDDDWLRQLDGKPIQVAVVGGREIYVNNRHVATADVALFPDAKAAVTINPRFASALSFNVPTSPPTSWMPVAIVAVIAVGGIVWWVRASRAK